MIVLPSPGIVLQAILRKLNNRVAYNQKRVCTSIFLYHEMLSSNKGVEWEKTGILDKGVGALKGRGGVTEPRTNYAQRLGIGNLLLEVKHFCCEGGFLQILQMQKLYHS